MNNFNVKLHLPVSTYKSIFVYTHIGAFFTLKFSAHNRQKQKAKSFTHQFTEVNSHGQSLKKVTVKIYRKYRPVEMKKILEGLPNLKYCRPP